MKAKVFTVDGGVKGEVNLPKCFEGKVRESIIMKALRSISTRQPYGSYILAGKEVSASGKQSHRRHAWQGIYGMGISRVPRKTMSSGGTRFNRVGAFAPGTRGGRVGHPPKTDKIWTRNINKKEKKVAFNSLIAATASEEKLKERYPKLDFSKMSLPLVVEDKIVSVEKSKNMKEILKKILGDGKHLLNKGSILLVTEKEMKRKHSFLDSAKAEELNILMLAPSGKPGRLVVYTEGAIEKLRKK
ncbi:50S ribosomal protein L4 [Nanoarchaeota archaeon]